MDIQLYISSNYKPVNFIHLTYSKIIITVTLPDTSITHLIDNSFCGETIKGLLSNNFQYIICYY